MIDWREEEAPPPPRPPPPLNRENIAETCVVEECGERVGENFSNLNQQKFIIHIWEKNFDIFP